MTGDYDGAYQSLPGQGKAIVTGPSESLKSSEDEGLEWDTQNIEQEMVDSGHGDGQPQGAHGDTLCW